VEIARRAGKKSDKSKLADAFVNLYSVVLNIDPSLLTNAGKYKAEATRQHDLAEDPLTPPKNVGTYWKNAEFNLISFYKELQKAINKK